MLLTPKLQDLKMEVEALAKSYGLDFFTTFFELVEPDQLNEIAAYGGFPTRYPHWRHGMEYDHLRKTYRYGLSKIYELVINNDPCYAYLLTTNSFTEQKLVMAHVYGHCDFFKNNFWFSKTNRKMIDKMANHGTRIRRYYDRFGQDTVEHFIDACLSIEDMIDPFSPFVNRPTAIESAIPKEETTEASRKLPTQKSYMEKFINPPEFIQAQKAKLAEQEKAKKRFPKEPEKDLLLFLLRFAPLEAWQRDVLSIVREEAYYFAPQRQTKIMNEGWASFWHSRMMTEALLVDSEIIDYAQAHAGAMGTRPGVINPYKLGIELYKDIEERWNKGRFGSEYDRCDDLIKRRNWDLKLNKGKEKLFEVRRIYNDVTFIEEFITPEFAENQRLFTYAYNRKTGQYVIADRDYRKVKEKLLFGLTNFGLPYICVTNANFQNRGELVLRHSHEGFDLEIPWAKDTLRNVQHIWGRPVHIESVVEGSHKRFSFDGKSHSEEFIGPVKEE